MAKILVDIDGVSCDLVGEVLDRLNKRLETKFKHDHITEWDFFNPDNNIFTEDELLNIRDIFKEKDLCFQVNLIDGVKETLEELQKDGHQIIWLTAPWRDSPTWCYDRIRWIDKHLGHISKNIIFAWNKEEIPGDILIDDNPEFLKRWEDKNFGKKTLLFRQPWNIKVGKENNFTFLNGWKDETLKHTIFTTRIFR